MLQQAVPLEQTLPDPQAALYRRRFWEPVRFVTQDLGCTLWHKQAAILASLRNHRRVAVRSCNGSGKTHAAACAVLWWLMSFPDAIAITTAPTEHQVRDLLWREVARIWRRNSTLIGGKLTSTSLTISDTRYAKGLSTDAPERFQGFHSGNILFVVDEASGVSEDIFEAIEGCMTSHRARLLLIGNPTRRTGSFFEAFHSRRALWKTLHISAFDTPNVVKKALVYPGLVTSTWVSEAAKNWGAQSPQYQVRVLGEFPSQGTDTLVGLTDIESAVGSAWPEDTSAPVAIGVDVARFGSDSSAICVRQGRSVISLESFHGLDTMAVAGRVADAIRRFAPHDIYIDEIGIGAGVLDRLRELFAPGAARPVAPGAGSPVAPSAGSPVAPSAARPVAPSAGSPVAPSAVEGPRNLTLNLPKGPLPSIHGINAAARSSDPTRFANLRAELLDKLRELFHQHTIRIPGDQELISQLASIRYSFTSSGQLLIESKETRARQGLPSPDKADALALSFAHRPRLPFKIWT